MGGMLIEKIFLNVGGGDYVYMSARAGVDIFAAMG